MPYLIVQYHIVSLYNILLYHDIISYDTYDIIVSYDTKFNDNCIVVFKLLINFVSYNIV